MAKHDQRSRTLIFVILALLALTPLTAEAADGKITGVTAMPSPATPGAAVNITVTGQDGPCGALDLDFGDGTPHATLSGSFPLSTQHTYSSPGTKTITAKKVNQCKGQASAPLQVKVTFSTTGGIAALCQKIDCTCLQPKIDGAMLFSNFTPGGTVALKGCGFGSAKGQFFLTDLKKYTGESLPDVPLNILDWSNTFVGGTIPLTVTQVKDQPVKFKIVPANSLQIDPFGPVNFTAKKEVKLLPMSDVTYGCSTESDKDWCNGHIASSSLYCNVFGPQGSTDGSAVGEHYTCHDWLGDDTGTDLYQATLKNGWAFDSYSWTKVTCYADNCDDSGASKVDAPVGFQKDTTWTAMMVHWKSYFYHGVARYNIYIDIIGPAGVPHK